MTSCGEIIRFMEKTAPVELAEEWDNVGLLVGTRDSFIKKIMLCLDITTASVREAVIKKVDMIITHHPVIFKDLKSLTEDGTKGRLLYELVRNNISVYSAHTNLDFAEAGVNDRLAEVLGLGGLETLGKGPGKTGFLPDKKNLNDYIEMVKAALNVPFVRVAGKTGDTGKTVNKAAVFSGSFDDDLEALKNSEVDVLVTGDLKYHTALDAVEAGLCIIDAGHFNTEKIILPFLAVSLTSNFPGVEVFCFDKEEDPFKTY
jgi:dinuclear metal center YbgI/SA1388 family protein